MSQSFRTLVRLPAQAATETEATIIAWHVSEGQAFRKGQILAEAESAKASFEFEAPCDGTVVKLLYPAGTTVAIDTPVIEVETSDPAMREQLPQDPNKTEKKVMAVPSAHDAQWAPENTAVSIVAIGGYVPERVVTNRELLGGFNSGMTEDYLFGVTGIRERRWASDTERPSDLALRAAQEALGRAALSAAELGAIVVATTTPDTAMPSTACVLQNKLGVRGIPAFDINAACSGFLYALCVAKGMVVSGIADNVLVVGVELQSRLLDRNDKDTFFLFGDGAGAAVVARGAGRGHRLCSEILLADAEGMQMARRDMPGYRVPDNGTVDPWIRLDGRALFRFATESFAAVIRDVVIKSGWSPEAVRWVVPHQANGRILKAAASRCGIPFERFYLNIDQLGNTSSASIPLALRQMERFMQPGDKLVLCAVGAGITTAAVTVEW